MDACIKEFCKFIAQELRVEEELNEFEKRGD